MSKTKITGLSTINFPSTLDGAVLTTTDVSKYVNTIFGRIFSDYKGCVIKIDQTANPNNPQSQLSAAHPVLCDLYFAIGSSPKDDKRLKAFEIIGHESEEEVPKKKNRMNFVSRMEVFQMSMSENKTSVITQDAIDIIQDLLWYELRSNLPKQVTPKVINERGIAVETCSRGTAQQNMFGAPVESNNVVYGVIRFVDINEILHMVFGDDEDTRCHYDVRPVRPTASMYAGMMPNMNNGEQKWLLYVMKLNEKAVRDVLTELGTPSVMGPNIATSTF